MVSSAAIAALLVVGLSSPVHAAEPPPDRVILTPTQHPSTSQSFTWQTSAEVTDGRVSIREVGGHSWRTVDAVPNAPLDAGGGESVRTHSATVEGLTPGTSYEYFVGTDIASSDVWQFTTAGTAGDPFAFVYFGDVQTELEASWRPVVEAAFDRYPDAVGSVHAGDLVDRSDDAEWRGWFAGMDGLTQTTNVIAAPGNHEYAGDAVLARWKSTFEFPANGPVADTEPVDDAATPAQRQEAAYRAHMAEALVETVYYTDYQGVRFISLNATRNQIREILTPPDLPACLIGCPDPAAIWLDMQAEWLDAILQDNPNPWTVATFHQPMFSTATGRDERDLREAWLPVLQRNDVDLVLMGHDHGYARGFVDDDATDVDGVTTGPVYVVSVAGPLYLPQQPLDDNVWTQNGATPVARASATSTFQGITVDGGTLHYEAIVAAKGDAASTAVPIGGVLDSFTITKYPDGEKFVTEDGVPVPPEGEAPGEPVDPPADEESAGTPADVPLEHLRIGTLASPTVHGPTAFDERTGILYVADGSPAGVGRVDAIDVATDAVLRSFEIGTPVTAMSFMDAEGGRLLIASKPTGGMPPVVNGRANAYSVNPASFGAPMIAPDMAAQFEIGGTSIDTGSSIVYLSLTDDRHIGVVEMSSGETMKPSLETYPYGLKVDNATGNLFSVEQTLDRAASRLNIYTTEELLSAAGEGHYLDPMVSAELGPGALNVDLDAAAGLAYVSHGGDGTSGVSVVDVAADAVTFLDSALVGADVLGLATSPRDERVYVSTGESVSVISRAFAPRITASPQPVTIAAGDTAVLAAAAAAVPAATAQWQQRSGDTWTDIVDATDTTYAAAPEATTQYRAVFTNELGGVRYSTATGSATVTVTAVPAPVLVGGALPGAAKDSTYSAELPASTGGPITSYAASGLPGGLDLTAESGRIEGTPTESGDFVVEVTATGPGGTSAPVDFTLRVTAPPVLSGAATAPAEIGVAFDYAPTFTRGFPESSVALSEGSDPLPDGLVLEASTGRIQGVPTGAHGDVVVVLESDNGVHRAVLVVTIEVAPPTSIPDPVDEGDFTEANRGGITADVSGLAINVTLPAGFGGDWVAPFLHSSPQFLGWRQVAGNSFVVQAPAGATGAHTIAVVSPSGDLLGWASVEFAGDASSLAFSGSTVTTLIVGGVGALVLIAAGLLLALLRRRTA